MSHVLVVGGGRSYYEPFRSFGEYCEDENILDTPHKVTLALFTGGADISPSLYGHRTNKLTCCNQRRDIFELMVFREALKNKIPFAGICRGAQFLCAMAGGTLFQHVTNHTNNHMMRTWDGRLIYVSSTHHQMQNPPSDAMVLAWADPVISKVFVGENGKVDRPQYEYECVYYPSINAVGIQYHPEMLRQGSAGFIFPEELVTTFVLDKRAAA